MRDFAKKGYSLHIRNTGYEKEFGNVSNSLMFVGFSLVASILFYGGVQLINGHDVTTWSDIPTVSWILWSISLLVFSSGLSSIKK